MRPGSRGPGGGGTGREGGPRDRTSFARDKLSTFFYYYCASMEFIPPRVGNRIAGTLVLVLIAILNIIFKSYNGVHSPFTVIFKGRVRGS